MNLDDKITKNFTWREVLWCPRWDVYVFPSERQAKNLQEIVSILQFIRDFFDSPISITSGLRPAKYNELIGGAAYSHHKTGKALDFKVKGVKPKHVREALEPQVEELGIRMEEKLGMTWTHIDTGPVGVGGRVFRV